MNSMALIFKKWRMALFFPQFAVFLSRYIPQQSTVRSLPMFL